MTPPEKYFGAAGSVLPSRSSGRQECAGPSRRAVQPNQGRPRWPPELPIKLTTPDDIDKASGALSMIRQLGGAFGIGIAVALFGHFGDRATPRGFCDGFAAAMGAAALLSFVGAIAAPWSPARSVAAPAQGPSKLAPTGEIAPRPSQSA
jgi:hypothetical protein